MNFRLIKDGLSMITAICAICNVVLVGSNPRNVAIVAKFAFFFWIGYMFVLRVRCHWVPILITNDSLLIFAEVGFMQRTLGNSATPGKYS